ncbi:MAG: hypothetical protein MJ215_07700 [Spirochaetia bacterium]|nr:hypothetical protein [Spirochaetia bacterium]
MKKKIVQIFAVSSVVIFLIVLTFLAADIHRKYKENLHRGEAVTTEIRNKVKGTYIVEGGFTSSRFSRDMKNILRSDRRIQSLVIKSADGTPLYVLASNPDIFKKDTDFSKTAEYIKYSRFCSMNTFEISSLAGESINGEVLYLVSEPDKVMSIFKTMFTIILIFIIFILLFLTDAISKLRSLKFRKKETADDDKDYEENDDLEPVSLSESGFSHRHTFREYLAHELDAASGDDRNLVLCAFRYVVIPDKELVKETLRVAENLFMTSALLFEDKDDCFNLIILDKTLREACDIVKVFVSKVGGFAGERVLYAGLSSRNGRLLSADTLIAEAKEALSRTSAENNIMSIDIDPEKYRQFIRESTEKTL